MPRDELVVAYSQSGRHALTPLFRTEDKTKTLLSAIWEKGLLMPAYLGGFYQPSDAVCLGKGATWAETGDSGLL